MDNDSREVPLEEDNGKLTFSKGNKDPSLSDPPTTRGRTKKSGLFALNGRPFISDSGQSRLILKDNQS